MKLKENNPQKKKVLIILGTYRTGGKERQISELVKGLNSEDFEVYFYSRNIIAHYFDNFKELLAGYYTEGTTSYNLRTVRGIIKYIKKIKPDIIHSWATETSLIANIYNILAFGKYKIIDGSIRDAFAFKKFSSGWAQRIICNTLSKMVIANTKAGLKAYNCPPRKSKTVYNGISDDRFSNISKNKKEEIENINNTVIGMVATYSDKKDYKLFVLGAIELLKQNKNLLFIGIGNKFENFYEQFEKIIPDEYKNSIKLLDERSNVEEYVQFFDIGVLLTNPKHSAEGISNSIMEYMMLSKPVVASNLGGTPEIVEDHVNGFLIEAENLNQYIEKISILINDLNLRNTMGKNAKNTIKKKFTFPNMIEQYKIIYNQI